MPQKTQRPRKIFSNFPRSLYTTSVKSFLEAVRPYVSRLRMSELRKSIAQTTMTIAQMAVPA